MTKNTASPTKFRGPSPKGAPTDGPTASTLPSRHNAPALRRRILCMIYEGMLLFAVIFIAGYLFDTLSQSRNPERLRHWRQAWLFLMLGLYFVWFWTHSGQTLAMKTWRIRVVDQAGAALRLPQAIGRYLLSWIFLLPALGLAQWFDLHGWASLGVALIALFLPTIYMKIDRDGQFLHDRLAGTRLIAT